VRSRRRSCRLTWEERLARLVRHVRRESRHESGKMLNRHKREDRVRLRRRARVVCGRRTRALRDSRFPLARSEASLEQLSVRLRLELDFICSDHGTLLWHGELMRGEDYRAPRPDPPLPPPRPDEIYGPAFYTCLRALRGVRSALARLRAWTGLLLNEVSDHDEARVELEETPPEVHPTERPPPPELAVPAFPLRRRPGPDSARALAVAAAA
jgi:hypothetical protein